MDFDFTGHNKVKMSNSSTQYYGNAEITHLIYGLKGLLMPDANESAVSKKLQMPRKHSCRNKHNVKYYILHLNS
jgi:hypothetical protein